LVILGAFLGSLGLVFFCLIPLIAQAETRSLDRQAEMARELNQLLFNHRAELKNGSVGPKLGEEIVALCRRNFEEKIIDERCLLLYVIERAIPLSVLEKDLELFSTVRHEANTLLQDQEELKREGGYSLWLRNEIIRSGIYSRHELEVFFGIYPKT
jgi:hypothetical protein